MTETVGKIIIPLESKEIEFQYSDLGLTFDSSNEEIINAVADAVLEQEGINIKEPQGDFLYTIRKVEASKNSYLVPKAVAG